MKKIISIVTFFSVLLTMGISSTSYAASIDTQAAWITTVYNSDWPKTENNVNEQKKEMVKILDKLKDTGIDTIMFQVRAQGDALYKSNINPWSSVLTGTQGKYPGYDPLEYVISEAKKRGIKVHAWLNPYRVTTKGTDINKLSANHQARKNPNWVLSHDNRLYFNPELIEVKNHIVDTVAEIVSNYDIDGIHFDDYFYPANYPLPDGEDKNGPVANSRRNHINDMIIKVKSKIKSIDPSVKFGVSPFGIWKNKSSDPEGSNTRGRESYYSDYADTRYWVKNNMVDYIVPQVYWERGHNAADYETVVSWWNDVTKGTNVKLYIGQGIYKDQVAVEIDKQLEINKKYPLVNGSVYYTSLDLLQNRKDCTNKIKNFLRNNTFTDIKGHWAYEYIHNFIDKGYINGYDDNTFRPNSSITRAEFVKILNKVFNLTNASGAVFNDTIGHWAQKDIDIAVTNGICNGKSKTEFKPNDRITREEAAVMIARYKDIEDSHLDKLNQYKDASNVSDWAKNGVEGNLENKYLNGYEDKTIRPKNKMTRAEAVVLLSKVK